MQIFPYNSKEIHIRKPRVGRWSKKGKILAMQLKSASLKSMQAMNRDLLQQQHHTDTTVLNTPSKNLQSVNVLVVHHHTTKKQGPFKIGISDEHSQCNLNIVFFHTSTQKLLISKYLMRKNNTTLFEIMYRIYLWIFMTI